MLVNTQAAHRIVREAAPVAAAERARERHHRAVEPGRREHARSCTSCSCPRDRGSTPRARASACRSPSPDRRSCATAAAACSGKRLRRPRRLAGHVALRHRHVLRCRRRLASDAIEDEQRAHLRHLRDRGNPPAVPRDVDQGRRGRQIPVPDVVVHELLEPLELAGRSRRARRASCRTGSCPCDRRRRSRTSAIRSARTRGRARRRRS